MCARVYRNAFTTPSLQFHHEQAFTTEVSPRYETPSRDSFNAVTSLREYGV